MEDLHSYRMMMTSSVFSSHPCLTLTDQKRLPCYNRPHREVPSGYMRDLLLASRLRAIVPFLQPAPGASMLLSPKTCAFATKVCLRDIPA